jgi:glycosyltransferase involved in cell wall biosynthesis
MSVPSVSVIIPTYNRRDLLQRSLDSVFAQTYRDFEVVIVDDGSTDGTRAAIEGRSQVRYFFQDHGGPARARNVGIRQARGDILAFLDSDDVWWPEFLQTQVDVLSCYRDVALVCSRSIVGDKQAKYFPPTQELIIGDLYPKLYQQSFVRTPATVIRKSCLDVVGFFNESYPWSEDHDLWLRIARQYRIAYVNRCLVRIGRQSDNISRDLMRPLDAHLRIAIEVLDRNYDASRISEVVYRERISKRYLQFSYLFFKRGENAKAWSFIGRSLRMTPYSLRPYRYLLKGIFRSLSLTRFP